MKRQRQQAASQQNCQKTGTHISQQQTEDAATERQQHALCQQLPDKAPPARTQRKAHGYFTFACDGARQQEIGYIGASDQQDQSYDCHLDEQWSPELALQEQ